MTYNMDEILSEEFSRAVAENKMHGEVVLVFQDGRLMRAKLNQTLLEYKDGCELYNNFYLVKQKKA